MDDSVKKVKRKRAMNGDSIHSAKRAKHSTQSSLKAVEQNFDEATMKEHMSLLDSVKGHLTELSQEQIDEFYEDVSKTQTDKTISKSEARRLKKKSKEGQREVDSLSKEEKSTAVDKDSALEYLRMWSEEKEKWSFKKKTQFWLLQNMYNKSMVPKSRFKVLLCYLEGLRGHQRQLVLEKAQHILDNYCEEQTDGSPTKREYKRAVAILRALA